LGLAFSGEGEDFLLMVLATLALAAKVTRKHWQSRV
jgi:hypothetical protein